MMNLKRIQKRSFITGTVALVITLALLFAMDRVAIHAQTVTTSSLLVCIFIGIVAFLPIGSFFVFALASLLIAYKKDFEA